MWFYIYSFASKALLYTTCKLTTLFVAYNINMASTNGLKVFEFSIINKDIHV